MSLAVSRAEVEAAYVRIRDRVRRTPLFTLEPRAFGLDGSIQLKLEFLQHTGSFKPRGVFNRMLAGPIPPAGVIAASGGNHGAAVAYAAARLGVPAEIFVPTIAAPAKVERIRHYGAKLTVVGADYAETLAISRQRAQESGALVVHAYDQRETIAGQGTVGLEVEQQGGVPDTALVAVGGGGLIAGMMAWFGTRCRVVAVEPERAPTLSAALSAGRPVDVDVGGVAADSLGARRIGDHVFATCRSLVAESVLVSDEAIVDAQQALWDELRIAAEPGGSTAMAALLAGKYRPRPGERVVAVLCGANTETAHIRRPGS
jgi:threonine dehydratase